MAMGLVALLSFLLLVGFAMHVAVTRRTARRRLDHVLHRLDAFGAEVEGAQNGSVDTFTAAEDAL
jgi:hypothetical protein